MGCDFYEPIFEITADGGVKVRANSLEELLCRILLATGCETFGELGKRNDFEITLKVESVGFPYLLADLINALLPLLERENFAPAECKVLRLNPDGTYAEVLLKGERRKNPKGKTLIKAATYHGLELKRNGEYFARVIFDL